MAATKSPAALNPRVAIPVVLAAAAAVGLLTVRGTGAKPAPTPSAVPSASVAAPGTASLDSLLALTPEAYLASLPDPGTKPASAQEVARWRDNARKDPKTAKNWVNLGDALMQRSREKVDPHYYDYAHAAYAIALKQEPENFEATVGMAWVCGGRHQFDKSIAYAQKAITLNPNNAAPWGLIGDAQVETGDYDAAYDSYQKMLDIRPDASSYSRGAHLLFLTGNTSKAMQLMNLAVKTGGPYTENGAWCRAQLADMLLQTGMLLPAEIILKDAIKSAPENYFVLTTLGRVREARQDFQGAEAAYKKAIETSPQHAALVSLGDLSLAEGKKEQAEEMFKQVEVTNAHHQQHGNHDQYYMAGFFADHDRNPEEATRIIAGREPKSPMDQEIAAWVCYRTGRMTEAKTYIDAALIRGTPLAPRFFKAGMIYSKLGDRRKGSAFLNDALAKNPHFNILQAQVAVATLKDLGSRPPAGELRLAERAAHKGQSAR